MVNLAEISPPSHQHPKIDGNTIILGRAVIIQFSGLRGRISIQQDPKYKANFKVYVNARYFCTITKTRNNKPVITFVNV